jgi:hypothetical protein
VALSGARISAATPVLWFSRLEKRSGTRRAPGMLGNRHAATEIEPKSFR